MQTQMVVEIDYQIDLFSRILSILTRRATLSCTFWTRLENDVRDSQHFFIFFYGGGVRIVAFVHKKITCIVY